MTLKRFSDEDIYRRLLGILSGFPPKKTLSRNLDKRERDCCSVALFPFYNSDAKGGPDQREQTVNAQHVLHLKNEHNEK